MWWLWIVLAGLALFLLWANYVINKRTDPNGIQAGVTDAEPLAATTANTADGWRSSARS
jgi:hypothetical protein